MDEIQGGRRQWTPMASTKIPMEQLPFASPAELGSVNAMEMQIDGGARRFKWLLSGSTHFVSTLS